MTALRLAGDDCDRSERLSAEDMATVREGEFLAAAIRHQAAAAAAGQPPRGVCASCGAACLPQAVYCDADCRADDEQRRLVLHRQGRRA